MFVIKDGECVGLSHLLTKTFQSLRQTSHPVSLSSHSVANNNGHFAGFEVVYWIDWLPRNVYANIMQAGQSERMPCV